MLAIIFCAIRAVICQYKEENTIFQQVAEKTGEKLTAEVSLFAE